MRSQVTRRSRRARSTRCTSTGTGRSRPSSDRADENYHWPVTTRTGTVTVIEPATEKVLAELQEASVEDADRAVARARAAYPAWRAVAPKDRASIMRRIAAAIDSHREELARLEARNVGKPIGDARGEVGMVVDVFDYYAGAPER